MARALKFLESYGNRQTKLWKVLSKYDKLPDNFHDLQTTLQMEFNLLKKATLKNIENLHDAINLQQRYTTSLCRHVNTIYAKLVKLDKQIQTHCLYPHSQTNSVQINAPEYDSDIDGQTDTLPDIQPQVPFLAENTEEDSAPVFASSEEYFVLPQDSDRFESQSESIQNPAEYSLHQDAEHFREQHKNSQRSQLEDIPELEGEDWEDVQFTDADLIDHHNTKTESNRIQLEFSAQFEKSTDQEYYSQNNTTPGLDYYIPESEYYNSDTRPKQYKTYQNLNVYLPQPLDTDDLRRWHGRGRDKARQFELHSHRLYGKKTSSLES